MKPSFKLTTQLGDENRAQRMTENESEPSQGRPLFRNMPFTNRKDAEWTVGRLESHVEKTCHPIILTPDQLSMTQPRSGDMRGAT